MDQHERQRGDAAGRVSIAVAVVTVVAVVRVGIAAVRDKTVVFMPDLWETLVAAQAAGTGRQLLGAWSRLGLYHPGPAWFWWAAPFVWLSDGHPAGLALAAAALAATALAVTYLAARSATDGAGALVVAVVLAGGVGQLSTQGLAVPWNPVIVLLPITAGLVCVAVVVTRGSTWPAVAAVAFGTLIAQAHIGTLIIGGAIVIGALAAWRVGDRRTTTSPPRWHGTVLLLVAVVPWVPVAIDQVTGTGNAEVVARFMATGTVDERFPSEPSGPSRDLTVPSALRQLGSITSLAQEETAIWAGSDLPAGQAHEPSSASTLAVAALLAVALAAARPDRWRRGDTDLLGSWICRVGLLGLVLQVAATLRIRHEFRPYLVAGSAGVGLALWLGVGLVALHALRRAPWLTALPAPRRRTIRLVGTAALALGAVVAVAGFAGSIPGYRYEQRGDAATVRRVADAVGDDGAVIQLPGTGALQPGLALTARLQQDGVRVAARGRFRAHFSDLQRGASARGAAVDLWVIPPGSPIPEGCADLGTFQGSRICTVERP